MENLTTLENLRHYQKTHDAIYDRCKEIVAYIIEHDLNFNSGRNKVGKNWGIKEFDIYENEVSIIFDESWAYGGYDSYSTSVSIELFTSENFLDMLKEKTDASNTIEQNKRDRIAENERLRKIKDAEETLAKLKQ